MYRLRARNALSAPEKKRRFCRKSERRPIQYCTHYAPIYPKIAIFPRRRSVSRRVFLCFQPIMCALLCGVAASLRAHVCHSLSSAVPQRLIRWMITCSRTTSKNLKNRENSRRWVGDRRTISDGELMGKREFVHKYIKCLKVKVIPDSCYCTELDR